MDIDVALTFLRSRKQGVLTTIRRDGRPQLSNILYAIDEAGTVRISITADRAKAKNLARDPRGSLYVVSDNFWAYEPRLRNAAHLIESHAARPAVRGSVSSAPPRRQIAGAPRSASRPAATPRSG